jgi:hypothetical protein
LHFLPLFVREGRAEFTGIIGGTHPPAPSLKKRRGEEKTKKKIKNIFAFPPSLCKRGPGRVRRYY